MSTLLANRSSGAAFLCYHSLSDRGPERLCLPPEQFERQLHELRRMGWRSGTSAQLDALARGGGSERPTAFLTFDDGYADNHAVGLPLLRSYGFAAMIFVLPDHLDGGAALDWPEVADWHEREPSLMRSLTWAEVEALAEAGSEIASHTISHPHLDRLDDDELAEELLRSRRAIAERLGRCDALAYPFGDWDRRVARAAAAAGYRYAFTMPRLGQARGDALSMPRVPVHRADDLRRFRLKLSAAGRRLLLSPVARLPQRLRAQLR